MAFAKRVLSSNRAITGLLTVAALGLTASPALAHSHKNKVTRHSSRVHHAALDVSQCADPVLSQAFRSWGDRAMYTLVPGESANNFDGTGWTLSGGASIVSTTLDDGSIGQVLDLPPGSSATSSQFCVSSAYPTARVITQNPGSAPNLTFYVTYGGVQTPSTGAPSRGGAWSISPPLKLYPSSTPGWQIATFTFVAGNGSGNTQLYDFQVDPYAKR